MWVAVALFAVAYVLMLVFSKYRPYIALASAQWQLVMLTLLLQNKAERATQILTESKPPFASKEEYFAYVDGMTCAGDRIVYGDDAATVSLKKESGKASVSRGIPTHK